MATTLRINPILALVFSTACFSDPPLTEGSSGTTGSPPSSTASTSGEPEDDAESSSSSPGSSSSSDPGSSSEAEGSSGTQGGVLPLLAHWSFDGNTADQSGNDYDGELVGPASYVDAFLDRGLAPESRSDAYVDVSSVSAEVLDHMGALTVSMVLRADSWEAETMLFMLGNEQETPEDNLFGFRVYEGTVRISTETGDGVNHFEDLGDAPALGQWHRMTFVVEGDVAAYYVDEVFVASKTFTLAQTQATDLLLAGWWVGDRTLQGVLDEISVYGGAMTPDDVAALPSP